MLTDARAAWIAARDARDEEVAYAAQTKSGMGDKYRHEERAVRLRYRALKAVVEALNGADI